MITITRSLARHLRTVFRRAGFKPRNGLSPPLSLQAGPTGLRIRVINPAVAVEYVAAGAYPTEELTVALQLLDDCQGKQDEPVTLERGKKKKTIASWRDAGIPQLIEYEAEPVKRPFPELPVTLTNIEPAFWQALREASDCIDPSPTRYALNNILLRAEGGFVCASDGRQVYLHTGFQFPWTGDVMVPALSVLGCADVAGEASILLGKSVQALVLRIGAWTLVLEIDAAGRFPKLEEIVNGAESGLSLVRLTQGDAEFLTSALPRLPREGSEFYSVTLDLNGQAFLRAKAGSDAPLTEALLSNATTEGPPIRVTMDRRYLLRALNYGLTELRFSEPHLAVLAADERRKYIWMPLGPEGALGPAKDAIRIESPSAAGGSDSQTSSQPKRRRSTMPATSDATPIHAAGAAPTCVEPMNNDPAKNSTPAADGAAAGDGQTQTDAQVEMSGQAQTIGQAQTNGQARRTRVRKAGRPANAGAIEQAIALRDGLRQSVNKTNELIRSLKRQRQQSRLVQSTLASLKELQQAG